MEEAESHACDVSGSGAVVAHLAECAVCSAQPDVPCVLWLLAFLSSLWCGSTGEEEMGGKVFLAHANALPDEVVLVALQLLLQPRVLTFVRIFCLVCPLGVGRCEIVEVEDGGESDEAAV